MGKKLLIIEMKPYLIGLGEISGEYFPFPMIRFTASFSQWKYGNQMREIFYWPIIQTTLTRIRSFKLVLNGY